jgi:hypothetical protein
MTAKPDGIRVRDRMWRQALQPPARPRVIVGGREMNRQARAGIEALQRVERRLNARTMEHEPVGFGEDQIRGEKRDPTRDRLTEEPISLGVVLVAPATQPDPGAVIDEQPCGAGGARDTVPATRQRTFR